MSIAEVLDKAATVIEERGWSRHGRQRTNGSVCIIGAIGVAEFGDAMHPDAYGSAAALAVDNFLGLSRDEADEGEAICWNWNDMIAKDQQEVVQTLRAAAEANR